VKPTVGRYQTATKVKVLSPETINIGKGRQCSYAGRQEKEYRYGEIFLTPRGLRLWYGIERKLQEHRRSYKFCESGYEKENLSFMGVNTNPVELVAVGSNNRRGRNSDGL